MDWTRAAADTPICEDKNVVLRDVVQVIIDGAADEQSTMTALGMNAADAGAELIPEILEIFVPVVESFKSGGGCGGRCAGCSGCGA